MPIGQGLMLLEEPDFTTFEKKYQIIVEMGTGTYGTVYKVKKKQKPQAGVVVHDS